MSPDDRRRRWLAHVAAIALAALALPAFAAMPRLIVWNVSPSVQPGLYLIEPWVRATKGDLVLAWVPKRARRLADLRAYVPMSVPLIKPVAAVSGEQVCAAGPVIRIEGRSVATRFALDPFGRPMPSWSGCIRLRRNELFLLSARLGSFDGRYFGIVGKADVLGKAVLLWAR